MYGFLFLFYGMEWSWIDIPRSDRCGCGGCSVFVFSIHPLCFFFRWGEKKRKEKKRHKIDTSYPYKVSIFDRMLYSGRISQSERD